SILVVDGEPRVLEAVHRSLSPAGYSVRTSGSAEEGLTLFAASPSEVVISDYAMRGMDGLSFLRRVRELSPHTQRILATRHADLKRIDEKSLEGVVDRYLRKPWDAPALRIVVRSAVAQHRLDVENEELQRLAARRQQELEQVNATLEERVRLRTEQLASAKVEWERSFDAISDPVSIVTRERLVRRANLAYAAA